MLLNSNADKFHLSWGHESFVKNLLPDFQRIGQHPNIAACSKWHHASCCSAAIYRTSGKDRFYSPVSFEGGTGIATILRIYENLQNVQDIFGKWHSSEKTLNFPTNSENICYYFYYFCNIENQMKYEMHDSDRFKPKINVWKRKYWLQISLGLCRNVQKFCKITQQFKRYEILPTRSKFSLKFFWNN